MSGRQLLQDLPLPLCWWDHGHGWQVNIHMQEKLIKWVCANSCRTSDYPYADEIMDMADRWISICRRNWSGGQAPILTGLSTLCWWDHRYGWQVNINMRAELIKWVVANSYRTSHYPYADEIMDMADRWIFKCRRNWSSECAPILAGPQTTLMLIRSWLTGEYPWTGIATWKNGWEPCGYLYIIIHTENSYMYLS